MDFFLNYYLDNNDIDKKFIQIIIVIIKWEPNLILEALIYVR